ncbi:LytR family transcriptional regulator [Streptomyces sp. AJS327]|nr:LCP family protein [Streptomyces sp. AJS327]MBA0049463.1 LytR family transcriptional regulator [Streptomyces sp. AJS327]
MRCATAVSALVLAASGVGHALVSGLDSGVDRIDPFHGLGDRPQSTDGTNLLVVGVDGRDRISADQRHAYRLGGAPCDCTDTLMLVHLAADGGRASVVSLPRDSYVRLPAHTDRKTGERRPERPGKLNAAYAAGGPKLTVRTVERLTRVHVDHYLEVDFSSFMSTVDALGGVEICTPRPLRDRYSGLDLPAGTSRLNGGQALQYVRARHLDGGSDLGRVQRQQRFMASLVAKATDSGVLMNPVEFRRVASSVLESLRADHGFGADEMMALGRGLRGFSPRSSEFSTVPLRDTDYRAPGLGSTVRWDERKAARLFTALREDRPLAQAAVPRGKPGARRGPRPSPVEVAPSEIRVEVRNGTDRPGLGRRIDDRLRATGFRTTGVPANARRDDVERTTIEYDPRWDRSARSLAAALPGARLRESPGRGPVLTVTAGARHHTVRPVRAADPVSNASELRSVRGDEVNCGGKKSPGA